MTTGTRPAKRKIKGVLIDVLEQTVTDIEFEPTLEEMYRLIRCELIEAVRWAVPGNTLYVDEEGLSKAPADWFSFGGAASFVGNGLIVGPPDGEGDETGATVTASDLRERVRIFQVPRGQEVPA